MKRMKYIDGVDYLFWLTIVGLCVLLFCSCATVKKREFLKNVTEKTKDSTVRKETVKLDTMKVKSESATINVPFKLLRDSMLDYMERSNGRAKVIIQRVGNDLVATANCDSLEKVILSKDRELERWHNYSLQESTKETTLKVQLPLWFQITIIAVAALLLLSIVQKFLPNLLR